MKPWSTVRFVTVAALFVVGASGVGAACGGSDTGGNGGGATGGGGGKSTGTHHSTGSNTGAGGPGGSGSGAGGSTSTTMGTGGIDPGTLDCSAPSGTLGALKLTPFITNGLDHPVDMRPIPDDPTRMVIVNQSGILSLVKNGTLVNDPFLDISSITAFDGGEQGFLSVAFHPDYQTNHRFFVYYSSTTAGVMTVAEYAQAAGDPDHANATAVQTIITSPTLETNHNGGTLMFSPLDKMLYISWGDGGCGCDSGAGCGESPDPHGACGNGQNKGVFLGKILRLDIDHKMGGNNYTPAGSGIGGALPEIWDYGLRNPYRVSFDGCTGDLWIGDVGQSTHEEIDHEPVGMGGKNYGWRCVEGDAPDTCGNNTGCDCSGPFTGPLVSLDRSTAQTVIGGYVYRGSGIPALRGMYLFTDAGAHKVWVLDPANNYAFQADGNGNDNFGGGTLGTPVGFGQDLTGEMYVIDLGGQVYRIESRALMALRKAARTVAWLTGAVLVALVVGPWFREVSTFGFHDWDAQTSHRELVRQSLLRYHQFPGWDPFACGGFPAWGYVEADTVVVSPFLPLYLVLPMALALRLEVLGMALLSVAGAYLLASRFAKSEAARALVVVLWALDGRWALQTASGHTWHLAYAYLPWCLYFFERARSLDRKVQDLAGLGVSFAMLVYAGGIYPLPHAVLAIGLYAVFLAVAERRARPLATLAIGGALALGLAGPKLFPLIDGFGKAPRLIPSTETLDLGALWTMLTSRDQGFGSRPARVPAYGWHEWGLYISTAGAVALLLGFLFVRGRRETCLKLAGLVFLVLGFGAFHPDAPWTLLHAHVPVFRSQHVPSRFLYTAVLLFSVVAAAGLDRLIQRGSLRRPWLDAACGLVVLGMAIDVGRVAQKPMLATMWMVPPDRIPHRAFHHEQEPPLAYKRRDWAGPMYLAMLANTGVINCYGTPPFDTKGALPTGSPRYRGEAWLEGSGTAKVARFSPNEVEIEVEGAEPGELLVYNMNFDDGWHASTGPVLDHQHALATRVAAASERVVLTYRPPYLGWGLLAFVAAAGALAAARWRERREEGLA